MQPTDLFYRSGTSKYFYSSIHVVTTNNVLIGDTWFDTTPQVSEEISAGKLKFEQLKLIHSPEEIQAMLDKAINSDLESQITARLDSLLESAQVTINEITSKTKQTCESATSKIEQEIPSIRAAISSSDSLQSTINAINKQASSIKYELPDIDSIKQSLDSAKTEFNDVVGKLKTLFKD